MTYRIWGDEPPDLRPGATAPWPAAGGAAFRLVEPFDNPPDWELQRDAPERSGDQGNVSGARWAVPSTEGRAWEFGFDLEPLHTGFYGSIRIGLAQSEGKSLLDFQLYRGDHEPAAYLGVTLRNADGLYVTERIALAMEPRRRYRVESRYEPDQHVRVAVLDAAGKTLWDTGRLPIHGDLVFDTVDLGVRSGEGSAIEWDDKRLGVLLRGTIRNPYVLSAYLEDLSIACFQRPN